MVLELLRHVVEALKEVPRFVPRYAHTIHRF